MLAGGFGGSPAYLLWVASRGFEFPQRWRCCYLKRQNALLQPISKSRWPICRVTLSPPFRLPGLLSDDQIGAAVDSLVYAWFIWFRIMCVFPQPPYNDRYNRKVFPGSYRWYSFYISSFPSSSFAWGVAIDALEPQGSLADFPCQGNARVISMSNFGGVLLFGIQKIIDFKGIRPVFWIKWRCLPYIRPL